MNIPVYAIAEIFMKTVLLRVAIFFIALLTLLGMFYLGVSVGKAQIGKEAITIHTKGNCDALVNDFRHIYK